VADLRVLLCHFSAWGDGLRSLLEEHQYNFGHALLQAASMWPRTAAFLGPSTVSYAELASLVTSFARRMRTAGINNKSVVAINVAGVVDATAIALAEGVLG